MNDVEVTYTPAVVKFEKYDEFAEQIDNVVKLYENAEELEIKDVKTVRADINALKDKLETRRKEIKTEIQKPYDEFKKLYDKQFEKLSEVESKLKTVVDCYNENQKALRLSTVKAWFDKKAEEGALDKSLFEEYYKDFLKAGDFKKDSFELKKATIDKMEKVVFEVLEQENAKEADLLVITDMCAKHDIGSAPYIRQYRNGVALADVISAIMSDVELMKKQHEELLASQKKEDNEVVEYQPRKPVKTVDEETGEIATQWQAEFKITFPDMETAKKFGSDGGFYEQYGVSVERLCDWKKL